MKETDDKTLEAYLQGKDKVSDSYKKLQGETPSAELDQQILQAAQKAAGESPVRRRHIPYQAYPVAASVCLMVLAAALFLDNEEQLTSQTLETRSIPQSDMPAEDNQADGAEAFQAGAQNPETVTDTAASSNQVNSQQQEAVTARARLQATTDAAADEALAEQGANELAVSPVVEPEQNAYRQNADTWLAEIQRLQAIEPAQAAEEIRLFSQAYPDIDIDERLTELNQQIQSN